MLSTIVVKGTRCRGGPGWCMERASFKCHLVPTHLATGWQWLPASEGSGTANGSGSKPKPLARKTTYQPLPSQALSACGLFLNIPILTRCMDLPVIGGLGPRAWVPVLPQDFLREACTSSWVAMLNAGIMLHSTLLVICLPSVSVVISHRVIVVVQTSNVYLTMSSLPCAVQS